MGEGPAGRRGGVLAGIIIALGTVIATSGVVLAVQGMVRFEATARVPVDPPAVTVTVERATLRQTVRGMAAVTPVRTIAVPASGVVTRNGAAAGKELTAGALLGVIDERPVFLLPGAVPMYRALAPKATGRDVEALQLALIGLGYAIGTGERDSSTYGWSTALAVNTFYTDRGFSPVDESGAALTGDEIARTGIPKAELVTSPTLPLAPTERCGSVGASVSGTLCELTGPPYRARVEVTAIEAEQIAVGQQVWQGDTLIGSIGERVSGDAADPEGIPSTTWFNLVAADGRPMTPEDVGDVEILVAEAINVPVVDAIALRGTPDQAWVQTKDGTRVDVIVGLCVKGRCAVTGVEPSTEVLVGRTSPSRPPG